VTGYIQYEMHGNRDIQEVGEKQEVEEVEEEVEEEEEGGAENAEVEKEEAQEKVDLGYAPVALSMTRMKSSETGACRLPWQPLEGRRCTLSGIL
jgi:hypothetical protein